MFGQNVSESTFWFAEEQNYGDFCNYSAHRLIFLCNIFLIVFSCFVLLCCVYAVVPVSVIIIMNKPVGFYGPIAPPVPNARCSECSRASIVALLRAAGSIAISRRASCCCSNVIAGIAIGANFKMYLFRQFCLNRVEIFYNTQETHMQKIMDQNFEIRILWFLTIFWNFQKGVVSHGPSEADVDRYGRGQTRSQ